MTGRAGSARPSVTDPSTDVWVVVYLYRDNCPQCELLGTALEAGPHLHSLAVPEWSKGALGICQAVLVLILEIEYKEGPG